MNKGFVGRILYTNIRDPRAGAGQSFRPFFEIPKLESALCGGVMSERTPDLGEKKNKPLLRGGFAG